MQMTFNHSDIGSNLIGLILVYSCKNTQKMSGYSGIQEVFLILPT